MASPRIRPGRLRHRIEVIRVGHAEGYAGDMDREPISLGEWWADVVPMSASSVQHAEARDARITHRVTVRPECPAAHRDAVLFGDRRLIVRGRSNVDERNREVMLDCEEGVEW